MRLAFPASCGLLLALLLAGCVAPPAANVTNITNVTPTMAVTVTPTLAPTPSPTATPVALPQECVDSDAGKNFFVAGSVTVGNVTLADECLAGELGGQPIQAQVLQEYYCENNQPRTALQLCGPPNSCQKGACLAVVPTPEPVLAVPAELKCVETDGGKNYSVAGNVSIGPNKVSDHCVDNQTVREYSCVKNLVDEEEYQCPVGQQCFQGACRLAFKFPTDLAACKDTDGGIEENVAGEVSKFSTTYADACSGENVVEYYCEDNSVRNKTIACASGYSCVDGACKLQTFKLNSSSFTCKDSDGLNPKTTGTTRKGLNFKRDACVVAEDRVNDKVTEYYCEDNEIKSLAGKCTTFPLAPQRCFDGRCVPFAGCADTDGGASIFVRGTAEDLKGGFNILAEFDQKTDYCDADGNLVEYYCVGEGDVWEDYAITTLKVPCPPTRVCKDGACVLKPTPTPIITIIPIRFP